MLEDDVGRVAEDLLHALRELARDLEARLLLVGRLAALPHHPGELGAVDVVHRAELLHELALLGARDDAHGVGARHRAELGGEHAEPAGGAPDQHAVAGLEVALREQHAVRGEVDEPVRGGLVPGERLRLRQELLRLDLRELGERAPGGLVAPDHLARRRERVEPVHLGVLVGGDVAVDHDLVAGLPARDALADLPDHARGVRAADVVAVLGVVAVAPDPDRLAERRPDVVVVHAGRHHAHDHLERARLGDLDLLELEGVLRLALALLADDPGRHRLGQLARLDVDLRDLLHIHRHRGRQITVRRLRHLIGPRPRPYTDHEAQGARTVLLAAARRRPVGARAGNGRRRPAGPHAGRARQRPPVQAESAHAAGGAPADPHVPRGIGPEALTGRHPACVRAAGRAARRPHSRSWTSPAGGPCARRGSAACPGSRSAGPSPDRVVAVAGEAPRQRLVWVDASSAKVVARRAYSGWTVNTLPVPGGLALVLGPSEGVGPVRILMLDPARRRQDHQGARNRRRRELRRAAGQGAHAGGDRRSGDAGACTSWRPTSWSWPRWTPPRGR